MQPLKKVLIPSPEVKDKVTWIAPMGVEFVFNDEGDRVIYIVERNNKIAVETEDYHAPPPEEVVEWTTLDDPRFIELFFESIHNELGKEAREELDDWFHSLGIYNLSPREQSLFKLGYAMRIGDTLG